MTPLLSAQSLSKHFDGVVALVDFSCIVAGGEILGLLGPNGAGKTTLLNVITGLVSPDAGTVDFQGQALVGRAAHRIAGLGIARTFQDTRVVRRLSVLDNVLLWFRDQPGEELFNVFLRRGLCRHHEARTREKAMALLQTAGLHEKANDPADGLSYGQQKLLSLVCCLASDATLLLLDEPVAGIAPEMAERVLAIIGGLPEQGKSAIVIEHDIDALKRISHRMLFMDVGQKICEGRPPDVLNDPRVVEAYLD